MKRDPHDPDGQYERVELPIVEVEDVFCARESYDAAKEWYDFVPPEPDARKGYTVKAYGPHYDKDGVFKIGPFSTKDKSITLWPNPDDPLNQTITDKVVQVIRQREKIGMATYHRPLLAGDGRDTLQDAIEEAADLLQYLVKLKVEREGSAGEPIPRARTEAHGARYPREPCQDCGSVKIPCLCVPDDPRRHTSTNK